MAISSSEGGQLLKQKRHSTFPRLNHSWVEIPAVPEGQTSATGLQDCWAIQAKKKGGGAFI